MRAAAINCIMEMGSPKYIIAGFTMIVANSINPLVHSSLSKSDTCDGSSHTHDVTQTINRKKTYGKVYKVYIE